MGLLRLVRGASRVSRLQSPASDPPCLINFFCLIVSGFRFGGGSRVYLGASRKM